IAGCKVGPNYKTPDTPMPPAYGESATQPSSRPAVDLERWWEAFDDPILDQIIDDAVQQNLDLRAATTRLMETRAQRGVVAADWWPTANVDGSYTRLRRTGVESGVIGGAGGGGTNGGVVVGNNGNRYASLWNSGFDATWEIDVFGAVSRNVEAANA